METGDQRQSCGNDFDPMRPCGCPQEKVTQLVEILGHTGRVHYRCPPGDPLVAEALVTPGYRIRYIDVTETVPSRPVDNGAWAEDRDRLVGNLMDRWEQCPNDVRSDLSDQCPDLATALDSLYAHGNTGK